jgi:hypothetical protein
MAIPRRLLVVAASAATAGVLWYVAQRAKQAQERSDRKDGGAVDEASKAKDAASADKDKDKDKGDATEAKDGGGAESAGSTGGTPGNDGAKKELALFLAGDAWHDEIGWQALWEKDAVATPDAWLRVAGTQVLQNERKKLADHPALLAGCRRRWIVVCRYAGIDVGEAATLWNDS